MACPPGATGKVDINEGLSLGPVAADRNAGIAAVAGSLNLVGQHLANAPNMQSTIRKPVRPRAAQAAGSTPLPTVPGGQLPR